ncbi:hypothetical protein [Chromobacterium amazonense]|uniref:hypothetical protein n=1 Tax=Chromobacterium amazonense TaxID=1382803 RepID=UPI0031F6AED5
MTRQQESWRKLSRMEAMCKVFERLAWLKILICIGMMFFALHARAGTVDAYLTNVRNLNSYATHSQNAAYGFCTVFSCDPHKTFIANAGEMATIPAGRSSNFLMILTNQFSPMEMYVGGSRFVGGTGRVSVNVVSMGFFIESVNDSVRKSDLESLASDIESRCGQARTQYFERNGKKGVGVWFVAVGVAFNQCLIEIDFPHGELRLKDLVVGYVVSGNSLDTLPAGAYKATYTFSMSAIKYAFQNTSSAADLTGGAVDFTLRFKMNANISVAANSDVSLQNNSGHLAREVPLNLRTNSPFSISISSCTTDGGMCVMNHESARHSVPLRIWATIPNFETGEARQNAILLDRTRPAIFFPSTPNRTFSGPVHGAKLNFEVLPANVATMLGGRYSSSVTIIFNTAL